MQFLVLPYTSTRSDDRDYASACILQIYGRTRKRSNVQGQYTILIATTDSTILAKFDVLFQCYTA